MGTLAVLWVAGHLSWLAPHLSHGPTGWWVWIQPPHAMLGFGHDATGWTATAEVS